MKSRHKAAKVIEELEVFTTGEEAVAALPNKVRIGAFTYTLAALTDAEEAISNNWGTCLSSRAAIYVTAKSPNAERLANTLMHELLHAAFYVYGLEADEGEERLVTLLSPGLIALYKDNPWLMPWLKACLG